MVTARETKTKMFRAWMLATMIFGIAIVPFWWSEPYSWPVFLATLMLMPVLFSLFPLVARLSQEVEANRATERERWRAEYRQSSAAKLLNLKDF